jgi:hypothetical protein
MEFKHTQRVKGIDIDNTELAGRIGDLYYDNLADFLSALSDKIQTDGDADFARGRKKLAQSLYGCAKHIELATREIENAWDICRSQVEQWEKENGSNR